MSPLQCVLRILGLNREKLEYLNRLTQTEAATRTFLDVQDECVLTVCDGRSILPYIITKGTFEYRHETHTVILGVNQKWRLNRDLYILHRSALASQRSKVFNDQLGHEYHSFFHRWTKAQRISFFKMFYWEFPFMFPRCQFICYVKGVLKKLTVIRVETWNSRSLYIRRYCTPHGHHPRYKTQLAQGKKICKVDAVLLVFQSRNIHILYSLPHVSVREKKRERDLPQ